MSADGLNCPGSAEPLHVLLHVYDVAQGDNGGTVVRLNNLVGPKGLGLGGVFHGAIVLGTVEFSFGFCERGTGVYAVKAGQNPLYTFREAVDLGPTSKSMAQIRSIIQDLKQQWPGASYDLLYRNCCHFCEDLAERLEVAPVPGWLNRFASGAAATINMTQDTVKTVQEFGAEVGRFWNKTLAAASQQQQELSRKLQQQQQSWRNPQQQQPQQVQVQQQPRGLDGSPSQPRSSQIADTAAQAGQQLWSGLSQAGQQLRATTTRLAQAAATKTGSSVPHFGSFSSSNSCSGSSTSTSVLQQQQQHRDAGPQGPEEHSLLPGAQPKLSKQYRLSGGRSQLSTAAAAAAAGSNGGSNGGELTPFVSVDALDFDPFVCLVGEDDADDDDKQAAAVQNALLHAPTGTTAHS